MTTLDAQDTQALAADARARAIEWFVLLASGAATDTDRQAWTAWRRAHPAHEEEWARVDRIQQMVAVAPAPLAGPTLRRPARSRRRQVLGSLLGLGAATALGLGGWRHLQGWSGGAWIADARTGPGEQRQLTLADGSRVMLNTATALDVRFDAQQRALSLYQGEVMIETATALGTGGARDPRPLFVETRFGRVRALGTRFLLRLDEHELKVAVLESAVEMRTPAGQTQRLDAGQQAAIGVDGFSHVEALSPQSDAWTLGSLIVDNAPLADVIAELARYRRGHLACDPRVAALRVSGAFPVTDTDQALAALAATLPIDVSSATGWWVTVRPRGG